jgi:HSP20 family protein
MTLVKVNNQFSRSIDGLMKDLFAEFPAAAEKSLREDVLHYPPANITEKEASYEVQLAVPGYEKADFNISLESRILTISTTKKDETNVPTDKVIRREFSNKSFKRSFTIDDKIDSENINAKYENGVLKLELPKKEITKTGAKEITVL